jgi:RimJ/RimL family protein N-acetyltransferase
MDSAIVTTMFDFSAFPTLTTDRLILREFQVDDAADLFAFRSDPEEQKFNSQPMKDLDESVTLIDEIWHDYARQCAVHWAVALAEQVALSGCSASGRGRGTTAARRSATTSPLTTGAGDLPRKLSPRS